MRLVTDPGARASASADPCWICDEAAGRSFSVSTSVNERSEHGSVISVRCQAPNQSLVPAQPWPVIRFWRTSALEVRRHQFVRPRWARSGPQQCAGNACSWRREADAAKVHLIHSKVPNVRQGSRHVARPSKRDAGDARRGHQHSRIQGLARRSACSVINATGARSRALAKNEIDFYVQARSASLSPHI